MTSLPTALQPWAAQLSIFPRAVALELGPLVRRLSLALGPMTAERAEASGEPSGYDGLSRRGSYERLLNSEWLLLDEAPDEFLRRAGSAEHAFLHLGRRAPRTPHGCVALFDAGPDQLGSPRIAHLALLIVLAARAEARSATLRWAALQGESASLFEAVTPASVSSLLQARSGRDPTSGELEMYCTGAGAPGAHDELWLIGGERRLRGIQPAGGASLILVRDDLAPGARRVHLEVLPRGRPRATAVLDLPPPAACARLLRDPFAAHPAPLGQLGGRVHGAELLFAPSGRRLLYRTGARTLCAAPIPSSPREPLGRVVQLELAEGEELVAVTTDRKRLVAAVKNGDDLILRGPALRVLPAASFQGGAGVGLRPLVELPWVNRPPSFLLLDGERRLFEISAREGVCQLRTEVEALAQTRGGGIAITSWQRAAGVSWEVHRLSSDGDHILYSAKAPRLGGVVLGHHPGGLPQLGGVSFAVNTGEHEWTLPGTTVLLRMLRARASMEVVGVVPAEGGAGEPRLLAIAADRRSLLAIDEGGPQSVFAVPAGILAAVANTAAPEVAVLTSAGELIVYSLRWNAELLRLLPEAM